MSKFDPFKVTALSCSISFGFTVENTDTPDEVIDGVAYRFVKVNVLHRDRLSVSAQSVRDALRDTPSVVLVGYVTAPTKVRSYVRECAHNVSIPRILFGDNHTGYHFFFPGGKMTCITPRSLIPESFITLIAIPA